MTRLLALLATYRECANRDYGKAEKAARSGDDQKMLQHIRNANVWDEAARLIGQAIRDEIEDRERESIELAAGETP